MIGDFVEALVRNAVGREDVHERLLILARLVWRGPAIKRRGVNLAEGLPENIRRHFERTSNKNDGPAMISRIGIVTAAENKGNLRHFAIGSRLGQAITGKTPEKDQKK